MAYLDNIQTFVRVYELGGMSAAARDQRLSAAVVSSRLAQLEEHLGVRLFQRTTRSLKPTEHGELFYAGARKILEAVRDAETEVSEVTGVPRGTLFVSAPFSIGRRFVAPLSVAFREIYPEIMIRLRLSDRMIDTTGEGLDVTFFLGEPKDSSLRIRRIATCRRLLAASPDYLRRRGAPESPQDLRDRHDCLNLRFPGAPDFKWPLEIDGETQRLEVGGALESDDSDVLTAWALEGQGVVLKPVFEIADHLKSGALVPVLTDTPPTPIDLCCLYTHRRMQDHKTRLFIDFMVSAIRERLAPPE